MSEKIYDIIIIGAGTAGMTSAVYARRAGKSVLVLESENFGGQILYAPSVENFPSLKKISGTEFAANLMEQAADLGSEFELDRVTAAGKDGRNFVISGETDQYRAKSVIIATGVRHRKLGLAGEERLTGDGVSYCALCDGAFYRDRDVAVAGGGNTALQDAMFLSSVCRKVYLIHRRDTFRGEKALVGRLSERDNVQFITDTMIKRLIGDRKLEALEIENKKTGDSRELKVDGLFVAVGNEPDNRIFEKLVKLDEAGYIAAGEDTETSQPGVFAAGDCRTKKVRQLATAAGDGAVAAMAACEFVDSLD